MQKTLCETRNSRHTVNSNSMFRIHSESRSNVGTVTKNELVEFKMVLNCYLLMVTTNLWYLGVICENGSWDKKRKKSTELENDKWWQAMGLDLIFLKKTYHWPPWLTGDNRYLTAEFHELVHICDLVLNYHRLMGTTKKIQVEVSEKDPRDKIRVEPIESEINKWKAKGFGLTFLMKTYCWPPWPDGEKDT